MKKIAILGLLMFSTVFVYSLEIIEPDAFFLNEQVPGNEAKNQTGDQNWLNVGIGTGYPARALERDRANARSYSGMPLGGSIYVMVQPLDLFGITLDLSFDSIEGTYLSLLPTLILRPSLFEIAVF